MIDVLTAIGGLMLAIITFFLKQTMSDLKDVKEVAYKNKTKLEVMENDYMNKIGALNQKFDLLYNAINKLSDQIEELNKRMK